MIPQIWTLSEGDAKALIGCSADLRELRRVARRNGREAPGHTCSDRASPEAWLHLGVMRKQLAEPAHFFGAAAKQCGAPGRSRSGEAALSAAATSSGSIWIRWNYHPPCG